jgi:hypothetical protein
VEKKTLFIGIQDIKFFTIPQTGEVGMQLLYPKDQTGLVPNIELGVRLSPREARRYALLLERKADEAEGIVPPSQRSRE